MVRKLYPPEIRGASVPIEEATDGTVENQSNIKVVVRVRPCLESSQDLIVSIPPAIPFPRDIVLKPKVGASQALRPQKARRFTFNRSFIEATQKDVFEYIGKELVDNVLKGFNSCVLAYGQTGSGKTYTMIGTDENPGLIPRVCSAVLNRVEQLEDTKYSMSLSFFEIYQENVYDLLHDNNQILKIREGRDHMPFVDRLTKHTVKSMEEVNDLLRLGVSNRTTASTRLNKQSSRSHSILTLDLEQERFEAAENMVVTTNSSIRLVDLAGSERIYETEDPASQRMKEGSHINKSLTTLGRVMKILVDNLDSHRKDPMLGVPYRESILTWLMKDNFGGNSKTTMVACVSPNDFEETLSTLRFAGLTSKIENNVKRNRKSHVDMDILIRRYQEEREELLSQLEKMSAAKIYQEKGVEGSERRLTKLENYIQWQDEYIDRVNFTNRVKLHHMQKSMAQQTEKNHELEWLALNLSSKASIEKLEDVCIEDDHGIQKLGALVKELHDLNILDPLYELERETMQGSAVKYAQSGSEDDNEIAF